LPEFADYLFRKIDMPYYDQDKVPSVH